MVLEQYYNYITKIPHDLVNHLGILKEYASKCDHITEFGSKDGYSTTALLMGNPKKLITYDIVHCKRVNEIIKITKNIEIIYNIQNVLEVEIEPTELLFIDTFHVQSQLDQELKLHADKVSKYIILHDTNIFGFMGEDEQQSGLIPAYKDFILNNKDWEIEMIYPDSVGLTILRKKR